MAIVHHLSDNDRGEIRNYPENDNKDGILTYSVTGKNYLTLLQEVFMVIRYKPPTLS